MMQSSFSELFFCQHEFLRGYFGRKIFFDKIYTDRSLETIREWSADRIENSKKDIVFYPEKLLALTSGTQPDLNLKIRTLMADIYSLTINDPFAEVIRKENFHITFLAITQSIYESLEDVAALSNLKDRFGFVIRNNELKVRDLRLVALPNQLLLAGTPDNSSIILRQKMWDDLINSEWASKLISRYQGNTPPDFWHTTILRYKSHSLPPLIKDYFLSHCKNRYDGIEGKINLVLAPYDWHKAKIIC